MWPAIESNLEAPTHMLSWPPSLPPPWPGMTKSQNRPGRSHCAMPLASMGRCGNEARNTAWSWRIMRVVTARRRRRPGGSRQLSAVGATALVLCCAISTARADGPFEGTWNAGPTTVQVRLESWGVDCGPRPQNTTVPAAGRVQITHAGDHLVFHGQPTRRTDSCWSENRAVRRVSTSALATQWRTTCRTPPTDPRAERGTYTLTAAGNDRLLFVDEGHYDWQLNDSRCVAQVTSRQTFTRVTSTSPAPTPPGPAPPTETENCRPGEPARLTVRPAELTLEPGEEGCFRARVTDRAGCALSRPSLRWELHSPEGARATFERGCFQADHNAALAEGTYEATVTSGTLSRSLPIVVRTADLSDLIAKRIHHGAVTLDAEGTGAESVTASSVEARAERKPTTPIWIWTGAASITVIALMIVALVLRRRRASNGAAAASLDDVGVAADSPAPAANSAAPPAGVADSLICPTCRRGFPADSRYCPHDSAELLPYAEFNLRQRDEDRGARVCPQCGAKYGPITVFCGKDGSELVPEA